jgi:predicted metal-dependent peptidase
MSNAALDKRGFNIDHVCFSFISQERFYATILAKMKKQPMEPNLLSTLAVGFSKKGALTLFYNKNFFEPLKLRVGQGCLEHEVLHVFFQHLSNTRFKRVEFKGSIKDRIRKAWHDDILNRGQDCAINQYLGKDKLPTHEDMANILGIDHKEYAKNLPKGHTMQDCMALFPETYDLPRDRNAEFYIDELMKKFPEPDLDQCPMCGSSQGQKQDDQKEDGQGQDGQQDDGQEDGQQGQDQGDQDGKGQQDDQGQGQGQGQKDGQEGGQDQQDGQGQGGQQPCPCCGSKDGNPGGGMGGKLDDHSYWNKVIDEETGEVFDAKDFNIDVEYIVKDTIDKSISECKNFGSLPAFIQKAIDDFNAVPRVNWKSTLRVFMQSALQMAKRVTRKRVSRRIRDMKWIFPGKKKSRRPRLLYARDASGSMFNDDVQKEINNELVQVAKRADVFCADFDTKIHQHDGKDYYRFKKPTDLKPYKGGGGTCFKCVFELAKKLDIDGIVMATDTHGSFPTKEKAGQFSRDLIILTFGQEEVEIPYGRHVNIPEEDYLE